MKQRILTGWNFRRVLYVAMGAMLIVESVASRQWWSIAFGAYFASMGVFSFGCAAGNCAYTPVQNTQNDKPDIEFEEVKTK